MNTGVLKIQHKWQNAAIRLLFFIIPCSLNFFSLYSSFNARCTAPSLLAMGVPAHLTRGAKKRYCWHPTPRACTGSSVHLVSQEHGTPEAAARPQGQPHGSTNTLTVWEAKPQKGKSFLFAIWKGTRGPKSWKGQLNRTRGQQWCCGQKLIKIWSVSL